MANSFIFAGDAVLRHGASGVLLPPAISATHKIMHGCTPISAPMEITGVDKNCVFEIDGRPALDVVLETLGADTSEASLKRVCLGVSVGKNYGFGDDETTTSSDCSLRRYPITGQSSYLTTTTPWAARLS